MKFLAVILLFFFFATSVNPCPTLCVEPAVENPVHASQETDDCSTLCVCTCCGIVFDVARSTIDLITPFVQPQLFVFLEHYPLNDAASNIWQPPKTA